MTKNTTAALPPIIGKSKALPDRVPLPAWARELIESMTAKNWGKVKAELLK